MEMKNVFAVAAVLLLLVSPMAFAREAESGGSSGAATVTGGPVPVAVAAQTDASDTSIQPACPDAREVCQGGTVEYKQEDSNGCVQYRCRKVSDGSNTNTNTGTNAASSDASVKVSIAASPQEVQVGDTVKVVGTVSYTQDPNLDAMPVDKKFKVELKMTGMEGTDFSRPGRTISLKEATSADSQNGRGSDDIFTATARAVSSIFGGSSDGSTDVKQEDKNVQAQTGADSTDDSNGRMRGSGSGGAVVSAVSTAASASQDRTDYIVLKSGESKTIDALFTARNPGMKIVRIEVSESTGATCPPQSDPAVGMPCRENFRKVAEASTKVRIAGQVPPPPPGINGTTNNNTVASSVIVMSSGWNMVSVPVMAKVPMQRVQDACGSTQYAWRLTQGGYVKESTLVPGFGYWIKAAKDCKVDVNAGSYTSEISTLFAGWNLVGALGSDAQVADFKGSCDITAGPWYYNNGPQASASPYVLASTLSPGKAYWIKVSSACQLGATGEQPPVPPA
ncbi:MAG: hypothetical protein NTV88_00710 [Candidatus Micrarchaeota archaeon]|nr:hypothetical protein [Candidatus Micrarchaeota archaeon]